MTTLLLTGAGGFLGSHILQAVLERTDWDVVVVDSFRHNGGQDRVLDAMADMEDGAILQDTMRRVRVLTHDLRAPLNNREQADLGRVDYLVHAAARCSVDDSIADPYGHVRNNIEGTLNMLALGLDLDVARFVQISTDEVYGHGPFVGETDHKPSSPYSASKAACEDLVRAWALTYSLPAVIVNSANLFGPRQSQLAFIPKVIRAVAHGEPITIHTRALAGDAAPAWRNYTYAPNVAYWLVDRLAEDDVPAHRYLLRGQAGFSVLKLAQLIAGRMGQELKYELARGNDDRPGFDPSYEPMPRDGSWDPEVDFMDGLRQTITHYLGNERWMTDDG